MKRALVVPDVHLSGSNYGRHRDCLAESVDVLERLRNKITELEPDFVILGGDFFHSSREDNLYLLSVVSSWLFNISKTSKIYAVRGNHEISRSKRYTTYDFIMNTGVVNSDKLIEVENCRIYLVDYSRNRDDYKKDLSSAYTNIGIFHDNIIDNSVLNNFIGEIIPPEEVLSLTGVYDYMVINHIHNPIGKYRRNINGKEVEMVIPGSVGRTYVMEIYFRNYANLPLIIMDGGQVSIELEQLELSPYEEIFYFDDGDDLIFNVDRIKAAIENYTNMFVPISSTVNDLAEYIKRETPEHLLPKMYRYLGWS